MTSSQVTEWIAYNELEPIGAFRQDYGFALICSTMVNMGRSVFGAKDKKEVTPLDFMPWIEQGAKPKIEKTQTVEEMKKVLYSIARFAGNSKKVRKRKRKKK